MQVCAFAFVRVRVCLYTMPLCSLRIWKRRRITPFCKAKDPAYLVWVIRHFVYRGYVGMAVALGGLGLFPNGDVFASLCDDGNGGLRGAIIGRRVRMVCENILRCK